MKTIYWEVRLIGAPTAVRYCKRCGEKAMFESSGLFRINAQQKHLDIWLIYKCQICDTTWNLTVYSRINPHSLPPEKLNGYMSSDNDLAMLHSTDTALLKRNGAECGNPEIRIDGPDIDFSEAVELHVNSKWPTEIKAAAVIREKLGLSRSAFEKTCEQGKIICISGHDLKKCKLNGEIVIRIKP